MEEEQEEVVLQSSKHVCKVCCRRFACGRALGGHMRIHGSASVNQFSGLQLEEDDGLVKRRQSRDRDEEEEEEEAEDSCGADHLQIKKSEQMYDLRPNRRRTWRFADLDYSFAANINGEFCSSKFPVIKNYQACVECGEEFSSWKSLIRHMECHFDDHKVGGEDEDEDEDEDEHEQSQSNVKEEEEEEEEVGMFWDSESDTERAPERKKSTKGKRSNRSNNSRIRHGSSEVEFMASCLVMLASSGESWEPTINKPSTLDDDCTTSGVRHLKRKRRRTPPKTTPLVEGDLKKVVAVPKKMMKYECKTCKKIFSSFQALGGHRASHNKVKGCSAKQDDELEEEIITSDEDLSKDLDLDLDLPKSKSPPEEEESVGLGSVISQNKSPWLDLNLPAAPDDDSKWFHQNQGLSSISTPT